MFSIRMPSSSFIVLYLRSEFFAVEVDDRHQLAHVVLPDQRVVDERVTVEDVSISSG